MRGELISTIRPEVNRTFPAAPITLREMLKNPRFSEDFSGIFRESAEIAGREKPIFWLHAEGLEDV